MPQRERSAPVVIDLRTTASSSLANSCFWYEGSKVRKSLVRIKQSVECNKRSDPVCSWGRSPSGENMSSFFRSLGSKKKSKSSLALSEGSDWGGNKTGGSWSEERRRQVAAAEERGERLERENNLLRLKVFI